MHTIHQGMNHRNNYTPFEVMFARTAVLPIDLTLSNGNPDHILMESFDEKKIDEFMEQHKKELETVKDNIIKAQERQKAQYDCKHSNPTLDLLF